MAEKKMQLEDWLDDLCVRFIINLPQEDLSSVARICFQVEEAQWFYEDFIRPLDPTLPSMSLRSFCLRIFRHCPLLAPFSVENHMRAFEEFLQYKTRVPVRGAILLNEAMDSTVLVKGWKKGANWSFPRGKINKDEDDLDCAIREVYEETGFDIRKAGLVPKPEDIKYIEITMREQQIRLYVFRNVPMDIDFQPKTRKEISKIQWYRLSELPAFRKKGNNQTDDAAAASNANRFYMVAPFLVPLKKWVIQQKKKDAARASGISHLPSQVLHEEPATEDDIGTQTEPVTVHSAETPAIRTLEGATLELQRLLKVQPPTQGIQVNPEVGSASRDKGEALMAVLRSKSSATTPLEGPRTQEMAQGEGQPYLGQPHFRQDFLSQPLAPQLYRQQPQQPQQPHPSAQIAMTQNHYQHLPPPPNTTKQAHYPFSVAQYRQEVPQGHVPPQNYGQPALQNTLHGLPTFQPSMGPVLLHPQPLPPQVQQSRLTRDILSTPKEPPVSQNVDQNFNNSGFRNTYGPGTFQQAGPNVPLSAAPSHATNHSLDLLNSFKSDNSTSMVQGGPNSISALATQYPISSQLNSSLPATPASIRPHVEVQSTMYNACVGSMGLQASLDGATQFTASQAAADGTKLQKPPTDKHRSDLLDMFKTQGTLLPTSDERIVKPLSAAPVVPTRGEGKSAGLQPSAATIAAANRANGGPVVMDAELNLPFRALQILTRPQGSLTNKGQPQAEHRPSHHTDGIAKDATGESGCQRLPSRSSVPSTQPVVHMEQPATQRVLASHSQSQYQPLTGFYNPASFSAASMLQRRQESNPEQKQQLLSLFGTPPASRIAPANDDKGKSKDWNVLKQAQVSPQRSHIPSIASASGEGSPAAASVSRRGSQTPISPADRDFLLGYLQSVTEKSM
ncbi:hypothetical protein VTK73DRAFT_5876 [Phialemonium thermophilum]|uniref:Nudix hydrolase domain-containing protein n=1 Tax=Phialemonium thermophilum TaxID=223376 RepID=A0ABR3XY97_9PEZI